MSETDKPTIRPGELIDLTNRVAYVIGAGTGHGRAIARLFAQAGAHVFSGHVDRATLAPKATDDGSYAGRIATAVLDLADETSIAAWFEAGLHVGSPDILVNAATLIGTQRFEQTSLSFWDRLHAVNARGPFIAMQHAIRAMIANGNGGRIINITTIGATVPVRFGNTAYSSSKAAIGMAGRNAAFEHAASQIMINTVAPGYIMTEEALSPVADSDPNMPPGTAGRHLSGQGSVDDVAMLALFLAGPGGRFITGQTIAVDGGFQVG